MGVGRGRSTSRSCGPVRGSGHRLHLSDARGPDRERPAARDPPGTDESPHPVFRAWRAEGKCAVGASRRICPSWAIRSIIVCGLVHSHVQPPGRVAPACSRRSHCRHRLRYSQSARGVPDELIRRRESFQAISAESCPAVAKPSTVCLCNGARPAGARFQGSAARRPPEWPVNPPSRRRAHSVPFRPVSGGVAGPHSGHPRVFQNAQWWRGSAVWVGAMWSGARESTVRRGQCGDDGPFGSAVRAKRVQ